MNEQFTLEELFRLEALVTRYVMDMPRESPYYSHYADLSEKIQHMLDKQRPN